MEEAIKKEILYDLGQAITILQQRENKDVEELRALSDHGIEDVAVHKNLDLISVTVLIYSLYKIITSIPEKDYQSIIKELQNAKNSLEKKQLGRYNSSIKNLFQLVRKCNAKVKVHLQDVMEAAKIKKSAALFEKGLSIGQAAGLMGLSNWDLQAYAGKTTSMDLHEEKVSAQKRVSTALKIFGVS
ncbi:hypothetical protein HYV87_01835 [Candidatus Woesearchaeota archaeon]|nr:hypothetical protein [Candidatus Woesearchaeota archaeon]MBI2581853.1 hypothetical protein [Candidatus Woesearchaeota archaeon]